MTCTRVQHERMRTIYARASVCVCTQMHLLSVDVSRQQRSNDAALSLSSRRAGWFTPKAESPKKHEPVQVTDRAL
jgi:hypothetical protein